MDEVATYIGKKGYTIKKENMEIEDQLEIRKDLMVKPFVPKSSLIKPKSFPVYRESQKKFYIPRFYGINTYGEPDEIRLSEGEDIKLKFKGELRDFQKPIVETYLKHAKIKGSGLLEIHTGAGKTVMGLNIIASLKKKTLIIVHKEFLLRQWKERIEQFLPDARVGKIQGPTIDIEDKDIVIGMLQSLSIKDYDINLFSCFGLTIIDEVHHISAEVFSRVLFKVVTKYYLGLSATMKRTDGLTKVIKMFLGEVVYKKERKGENDVMVKAIQYETQDENFNEISLDWRGNVKYSTMMKKLCEFNPRREFILNVLEDTLKKGDMKQQIMILAHNKSILTYIHDAIKHRGMATVGYYIGGMKEIELKKSEGKKVIIATYAMAEEGLDIKSLNTLIMASPKVNITQAVGRILRSKEHSSLVIDIVDQHGIFQRQYKKRKAIYKRQKFKLLEATMDGYKNNEWQTLLTYVKGDKKSKVKKTKKSENIFEQGKCMMDLSY
tara:strand:- start:1076 stop:2557 length:1482 start_codon:yes stop_codon:yes gene_type:complete